MLSGFIKVSVIAILFGSISFAQTGATETPFTASARLRWLVHQNLSPAALLENVAIGAEETLVNSPKEYGPHWQGYGERVGMVTANYGVKTVMEAGLGSIWGEDPRYNRTEAGTPFASRLGHAIRMTFVARNRIGGDMPAYARYMAIPGSSFLSNTWLPDSQATINDAAVRTGLGFLSRMAENAYKEFRPR